VRLGLIGKKLGHSFSKKYFEEKFQRENLKGHSFDLFELPSLDLFREWVLDQKIDGLSVTIPYKEEVIPFLDSLSDDAQKIGAVNCIAVKNGQLIGYNTDAFGFKSSIRPFIENKFERALILGTGGASKAIFHVLNEWNIPCWFVTRDAKNDHHIPWNALSAEAMVHFKLIINCTPLGTFPEVDEFPPLPYAAIGADHFLYDLVYNPAKSAFLTKGEANGAQIMNGLPMLQLQAERAWEIWNS
jgi:shikimate dehydrogenase